MAGEFQMKRGSLDNWHNTNPKLTQGEPGLELDTNKIKIGDGIHFWDDLPYFGNYIFSDLTATGAIHITGGTGCVLGVGTSITIDTASGSQPGLLSAADWLIFMAKYTDLPDQTAQQGKFLMSGGSKGSESWQIAPVDASVSVNKSIMAAMAIALS